MESEMPPIFLDCFALVFSALAVASIVIAWVIALLLLFVVFGFLCGCVVGVSFSLRVIATKKKGRAFRLVLSLFVGCGLLFVCYMFSAAFSASSFDFEKIHPAPQVRCALNLPPRALSVSLIARVSPITAMAFSE